MEGIEVESKMATKWIKSKSILLRLRPPQSMTFFFFERENGEIIYDETEILTEVQEFYERLYTYRICKDADLMALLPDIQTLSCEDSQLIEGSVAQYAEALAALSKMKKNKSPGSNGFSVEFFFFKFFCSILCIKSPLHICFQRSEH